VLAKVEGQVSMKSLKAVIPLLTTKFRLFAVFLTAQGITVAGNLLYGLLCVRLLPIPDYAKFVVLFGVQGSLVILMDVGVSGSLIPLVGEQIHNRQLIADYVASLRDLAKKLYLAIALGTVFLYPELVKNRHWGWRTVTTMVVILLTSTWFMRIGAAYGTVLIIMRNRRMWYMGQMISSLGTLALLGIFWAFHRLDAFSAILINVTGIIFVGTFYFFESRKLLGCVGVASPEKKKSIVRLALPNVPGIIFFATQGQISLFLITIFGHTSGVADIGALARLGQIFALFLQMNPILIEPYFAKLSKLRLKKSYLIAIIVVTSACCGIMLMSFYFPKSFLLILGPKYSDLQYELQLVIMASSLSYLTNVLWVIHSARRFIYWWSTILNIVLTLSLQVYLILRLDLSTIRSVLLLNLVTAAAALFTNALSGIYGFLVGPRQTIEAVEQHSIIQ
jgi:hypothetical protein